MSDHLTQRAQRLLDEFEEGACRMGGDSRRHGIGSVLRHLAYTETDSGDDDEAIPASRLLALAEQLEAPTTLDLALAGDKAAAREFLFKNGFTDETGRLLPHLGGEED